MEKEMIEYKDYKNLIFRTAWNYNKKYGLDFEELVARGNLAFCDAKDTFDKSKKTKFSTHLCWQLKGAFGLMLRERSQALPLTEHSDIRTETIESDLFFRNMVSKLSNEARFITEIVFETPYEIVQMCIEEATPATVTMGRIKKYLRDLGWTHSLIHKSYKEIQFMLKNL